MTFLGHIFLIWGRTTIPIMLLSGRFRECRRSNTTSPMMFGFTDVLIKGYSEMLIKDSEMGQHFFTTVF